MKKPVTLLFLLVTLIQMAFAQQGPFVYDNKVYLPNIKTVQCYNAQKEQSLPVIMLKSGERLQFSFDDLNGGSKNYSYAIEHCTADWKPSRISTLDYVESFAEDRIVVYKYSLGTLQKFTHYSLSLPNEQVKIKTSGNYLLKIYEDGNLKKPVISQRFYVVENLVSVNIEVTPSSQVAQRSSNQKINFSIFSNSLTIQNPYTELKAVVMQNGDPHTADFDNKPSFIKPGTIIYNDLRTNDFKGGNEYRKFDIRSLRYHAAHVQDIYKDSIFHVVLLPDGSRNIQKYTSEFDENGNFFIRNQEGTDNETEGEYAQVLFSLNVKPPNVKGDVYLLGRFNNYQLNEESRLTFKPGTQRYEGEMLLKQGLYDYKYVWKVAETGEVNATLFEGSFFETKNAYQVFVYFRKPGSRWDELVGYLSTQTETLPASH